MRQTRPGILSWRKTSFKGLQRGSRRHRSSSATRRASPRFNLDEGDSVTGSLEDLVNSFDEKLTKVFHDYHEKVEKIAPVQVWDEVFGHGGITN